MNMNIIYEEKSNAVRFKSLQLGEVFCLEENIHKAVFMRVEDCVVSGDNCNSIDIATGEHYNISDKDLCGLVEANLTITHY